MPPILMLIGIMIVVLMVAFGRNPMDEMLKEQEKYGKDPFTREINKFNAEKKKDSKAVYGDNKYMPPPGAKVYRLPPSQVIRPAAEFGSVNNAPPAPPPDIPMSEWGNSNYSPYMYAPKMRPSNEKPYEMQTAPIYNEPAKNAPPTPPPSPTNP